MRKPAATLRRTWLRQTGSRLHIIIALSGMGKVYYRLQEFTEARECLNVAHEEAIELENAEVQIICNYYLGRMQMDEGDYRQALIYLNHAFEMAEDYTRKHDVMSLHETLSVIVRQDGEYPECVLSS